MTRQLAAASALRLLLDTAHVGARPTVARLQRTLAGVRPPMADGDGRGVLHTDASSCPKARTATSAWGRLPNAGNATVCVSCLVTDAPADYMRPLIDELVRIISTGTDTMRLLSAADAVGDLHQQRPELHVPLRTWLDPLAVDPRTATAAVLWWLEGWANGLPGPATASPANQMPDGPWDVASIRALTVSDLPAPSFGPLQLWRNLDAVGRIVIVAALPRPLLDTAGTTRSTAARRMMSHPVRLAEMPHLDGAFDDRTVRTASLAGRLLVTSRLSPTDAWHAAGLINVDR